MEEYVMGLNIQCV